MSKSIEELDAIFAGFDLGPRPERPVAVEPVEAPTQITSVLKGADVFLHQIDLVLEPQFKLTA